MGGADSTGKARFPRAEALAVARELVRALEGCCERLVVAGSLRRRKREVGDVEILYIPRYAPGDDDWFAPARQDRAAQAIRELEVEGRLERRRKSDGSETYGQKNKLMRHRATGIPVDLFATTEEAWHNYLVCRTGPAALNTRIAMAARERGQRWQPYGPGFCDLETGLVSRCYSEREVFERAGLAYLEPWER